MKDMTRGNPTRLMLAFALPILLGNVFQLFYSLVDTRIVGSLLGEQALAAVGGTNELAHLLIGFSTGMMEGFGIITARWFGAGGEKEVRRSAAAFLELGLAIALGMTVLSITFLEPLLRMIHTPEHLLPLASSYFRVILSGIGASMLYCGCASLLRAVGDSLTPLIFLIISSVLNVGLDLLFVGPLQMGVAGAAAATVLSQAVSGVLCLTYLLRRYPTLRPHREDFRPDWRMQARMLQSGVSVSMTWCLVAIGSVLLQSQINTFGQDIIVSHTASRRLSGVFMMPSGVMGTTIANFAGQNYGAGKSERISEGMRKILMLCVCFTAATILVSFTLTPQLVHLVTGVDNPAVVGLSVRYMRFNSVFYLFLNLIGVLRGLLQGLGDLVTPIVSSLIEMGGKILFVLLLTPHIGYDGVILVEPVVWVVMTVPMSLMSLRHLRRSTVKQPTLEA